MLSTPEFMSPRPYRSTARRTATDQTRARILDAARELLASPDGVDGFSLDAIARRAGVVRMTVYYQFGSKAGLLEALFDELARRGHIERLKAAFTAGDALEALDAFITAFGGFYDTDRLVLRRLNALAVLDAEVGRGLGARGERRREGIAIIVERIVEARGQLAVDPAEARDLMGALTTFDTFDTLAGERSITEVVPMLQRLVRTAILGAP